jgi:hypothetical protein
VLLRDTRISETHFRARVHGSGGGNAALAAAATLIAVVYGFSILLTPLPDHQQQFGFSEITLTLIYFAYAFRQHCLSIGNFSSRTHIEVADIVFACVIAFLP